MGSSQNTLSSSPSLLSLSIEEGTGQNPADTDPVNGPWGEEVGFLCAIPVDSIARTIQKKE